MTLKNELWKRALETSFENEADNSLYSACSARSKSASIGRGTTGVMAESKQEMGEAARLLDSEHEHQGSLSASGGDLGESYAGELFFEPTNVRLIAFLLLFFTQKESAPLIGHTYHCEPYLLRSSCGDHRCTSRALS